MPGPNAEVLGFGDPIDEVFDLGIWLAAIIGAVVLLLIGLRSRDAARQERLVLQLEGTRELARQGLLAERRRIARDVHDFVGHSLAAAMLQITSARHVLRRDAQAGGGGA